MEIFVLLAFLFQWEETENKYKHIHTHAGTSGGYECCGKKVNQDQGTGNARDKTTILYKVVEESFSEEGTFEQRFEEGEGAGIEDIGERES